MKHFVQIHYEVPDLGGQLLNIAELKEISPTQCTMVRMIELDPAGTITGAYANGRVVGQANEPTEVVPHPDQYAQFEGITATILSAEEFNGLWSEARVKFPEL
ncbi:MULTISPECIES: hypothetical protein [unclassified Corynebacterium]|uniref:hypothetical protein n=1 Tax=unclassified Corynebacterium TaxID=2624378 RepID=UPI002A9173AA|nr:hypothetical protein [Corynebacterium sp.]MDY5785696.1 hypothetical protein [Corynebacterium sp.]